MNTQSNQTAKKNRTPKNSLIFAAFFLIAVVSSQTGCDTSTDALLGKRPAGGVPERTAAFGDVSVTSASCTTSGNVITTKLSHTGQGCAEITDPFVSRELNDDGTINFHYTPMKVTDEQGNVKYYSYSITSLEYETSVDSYAHSSTHIGPYSWTCTTTAGATPQDRGTIHCHIDGDFKVATTYGSDLWSNWSSIEFSSLLLKSECGSELELQGEQKTVNCATDTKQGELTLDNPKLYGDFYLKIK